ncbi:MAG TPA: NAD-binding protein [Micromonosporaceae bacterium]|nr:NAD-binding protein [Micromonosporaceae bacterium]
MPTPPESAPIAPDTPAPEAPAPENPVPSPRTEVADGGTTAGTVDTARRFVICGDTALAYRMAEELTIRYRANVLVLLTDRRRANAPLIARIPGVHVEVVASLDAAAFRQANLTATDAVALVTADDVGNVFAALQAQETCPGVRLVLRVFNSTLSQRLGGLFDNAQLLSDVEIAVPAFVAACLGTTEPIEVTVGSTVARVTSRAELADGDRVWCGLAVTTGSGGLRILPDDGDAADLVLASTVAPDDTFTAPLREIAARISGARRRRIVPRSIGAAVRATLRGVGLIRPGIPTSPGDPRADAVEDVGGAQRWNAATRAIPALRSASRRLVGIVRAVPAQLLPGRVSRGVRVALVTMFGVIVVGAIAYVVLDGGHGAWSSLYVMLLTTVGEANPDDTLPVALQILQTVVTFTGVALIPVASAAIVQASVPVVTRDHVAVRNHVVVVGLGNVGTRVLRTLHERGYPVVAIDHVDHPYGAQYVRERHIPFIVGDESRESTLRRANVAHAAALVVLTSDDVVNLEYALQGRELRPTLRVVLRLFDGDFADRVNEVFNVTISRSVSYLAASNFAAAMVGREVIGTIPIRRRVLLVADVPVLAGSSLAGRDIASLDREDKSRVVAVVDGSGQETVCPPADRTLAPGERLVVVATRAGLSDIVDRSAAPHAADQSQRAVGDRAAGGLADGQRAPARRGRLP